MVFDGGEGSGMSPYEAKRWAALDAYWKRDRGLGRVVPEPVRKVASKAAVKVVQRVAPQPVADAAEFVADVGLEGALDAIDGLLGFAAEWIQELSSPEKVLAHHRDRGRVVESVADLRTWDLEVLDEVVTARSILQTRALGVGVGAGLGAAALLRVGSAPIVAATLDAAFVHTMVSKIATQTMYAYGIDPTSDAERRHLERMLGRAWLLQVPMMAAVQRAWAAHDAGAGRERWSQKFRDDHPLAAALEGVMKHTTPGGSVSIQRVVRGMPVVAGVVAGSANQQVLGRAAHRALRYSQTVRLSEKYGLPLPEALVLD